MIRNSVGILAIALLIWGGVGCKNSQKTAQKEEASKVKAPAAGKLEATDLEGTVEVSPAEKGIVEHTPPPVEEPPAPPADPQPQVQREVQAPTYPDSLYLRLERTACYGKCPVFTVNIYQSGYAVLEGRRFFDYEGVFATRFLEHELIQFADIARSTGYFDFEHVYDAPVTDLPSCTTILITEERQNWVYNRMNAPDQLRQFEMEVETLIKQRAWMPYEGKKNQGFKN